MLTKTNKTEQAAIKKPVLSDFMPRVAIFSLLVENGFLATESGFFTKVENDKPYVIYFDYSKNYYVCDKVGETAHLATWAEILEFITN